jgi:SAM-dependent methyltransferase
MRAYWNRRFIEGGRIWGDLPSGTALRAAELFRGEEVRKILVPGCGYGRHTEFFAGEGFAVHGIEISDVAIGLAGAADSGVVYFCGSVLDIPFSDDLYDAVFGFNLLHLFRAADRRAVVEKCAERLRPGGVLFFTAFSEKEPTCGKGMMVEEYTYESKPGRPTHYFTEADLRDHFAGLEILETGIVEDRESHGEEGSHTHLLRYIIARKG